jgi:hypothetical protein
MTTTEIEAEFIRAQASAAYSELTIYRRSENALQQIVASWGDNPVFQAYAKDMGLTEAFAAFKPNASAPTSLEVATRDLAYISRHDGKVSLREADYVEDHLEKHPVLRSVLKVE